MYICVIITTGSLSSFLESGVDPLWIVTICVSAGGALLICILLCCISAICYWMCAKCCSKSKKRKRMSVISTDKEKVQQCGAKPV